MTRAFTYLYIFILFPVAAHSQARYSGRKHITVGGTRIEIYDKGVCFGQNPIFLVPIDTLGNVSFTAMINNVKVMGSFAPAARGEDTTEVQDPVTLEYIQTYDIGIRSLKNGEWNYYYSDGANYREYYNMGELTRIDSLKGKFTVGKREIKIVDSMARIRSIIDLYIKKGKL